MYELVCYQGYIVVNKNYTHENAEMLNSDVQFSDENLPP